MTNPDVNDIVDQMTDSDPILVTPAEAEQIEDLAPVPLDEGEPGDVAPTRVGVSGSYDPETGWVAVDIGVEDLSEVHLTWLAGEEGSAAIDLVVGSIPQALMAILPQLFPQED